jgi:hypothetical protein
MSSTSNPTARFYDPTRPPRYNSVGSRSSMMLPQQASGLLGNNPVAHFDRVARDDAPTEVSLPIANNLIPWLTRLLPSSAASTVKRR